MNAYLSLQTDNSQPIVEARPGMSLTTSRNLILQTFRFRGEEMGECENCEPSWFPG